MKVYSSMHDVSGSAYPSSSDHVPLRYFLNDHAYIEGYATMRGPGNQVYPGKVYFILSGGNIPNPYTHVLPTMTSREDNNDFWQSISDITKIARPRK